MTKRPKGGQRILLTSLYQNYTFQTNISETAGGQADWNICLVWILLPYKQNHKIFL